MLSQAQLKKREKYLAQYAEPIVNDIEILVSNAKEQISNINLINNTVVIPAYRESVDFVTRILALSSLEPSCIIVVINQPVSDENKKPQEQLFQEICSLGEVIGQHQPFTLIQHELSKTLIFVVDCFNHPLANEEGVGLARKIGCDLAIKLQSLNVLSPNIFGSTDGDAKLPTNYFSTLKVYSKNNAKRTVSALCFDFTHAFETDELTQEQLRVATATQAYETALRYYVDGLSFAGSSYNFFTIGSILAIDPVAYVDVRGFIKKSAGEDFYTLNKLAKVGEVVGLSGSQIILEPRLSQRVPFGTGPATTKIIEDQQNGLAYLYYHPQCFVELSCLLTILNKFLIEMSADNQASLVEKFYSLSSELSAESLKALAEIGFCTFLEKQTRQYRGNTQQLRLQVLHWFDAFKTLKFIHSVRAQKWHDIPLAQALVDAPFYNNRN